MLWATILASKELGAREKRRKRTLFPCGSLGSGQLFIDFLRLIPRKMAQKIKILFADDDPEILTVYSLYLRQFYDVVQARDGLEAWRLIEETRPRLVVTDLNMPGLNGLDLTERIREHPELNKTTIIILTGTTRNSDLPPGFWKIGTKANRFLEKPVTPEQVLNSVRRVLLESAEIKPLPPGKGYYDVH